MTNTQILLAQRPATLPDDSTWNIVKTEVPELQDGQLLIRSIYISLDPAMRGWLRDVRSYLPPVQIGEVMRAGAVGQVVASKHPDFAEGDYVNGWTGVQEYAISDGSMLYKVQKGLAPMPTYLSTLGMPGFTAYFGLLRIGKPVEGDTVLVSGGAGAVGSVVGQIAKIKGCRVVGIAGGPEKCKYMKETLGFDDTIDYKNDDVVAGIKRTCPKGINVYFDNVGGEILDAALGRLAFGARVAVCGAISQYNSTSIKGPSNYLSLLVNRASMEGFVVIDYTKEYGTAAREMGGWMAEGKLKTKEFIVDGIENFPSALMRLFNGDKLGKLVLKVGEE